MTGLHFDIDAKSLQAVALELGATEKQVRFAFSRALRRTAATLRKMSERGLKNELQIRKLAYLRRRLRTLTFKSASDSGVRLWYGLNDMPVSTLKGRIEDHRPQGASFDTVTGTWIFKKGFVAKNTRGQKTIFERKTAARTPLEEARAPVKDRMEIFVEDEIFDKMEPIFWRHFYADLKARAKFGVGATEYRRGR